MTAAHASTTLARDVDVIPSLSVPLENRQKHAFRLLLRNIWETCVDKRPHGVLASVDISFYFFGLITVHTRPDGDSENLALEKGTFIDLKMALLHSASHWVVDMGALTTLTS